MTRSRRTATTVRDGVVLVPGFLMGGLSMALLKRRLKACGFETHRFAYFSAWLSLAKNAALLNLYLNSVHTPVVHFVGHSLGGLVVRHLFHAYPRQRPGRVVTLGTPHQGSRLARKLARTPSRLILGRAMRNGLAGGAPPWDTSHELGVIAGGKPTVAGSLTRALQGPNDGTILVEETRLSGMRAHVTLPVNHIGLLAAPVVAQYICRFLQTGAFPAE